LPDKTEGKKKIPVVDLDEIAGPRMGGAEHRSSHGACQQQFQSGKKMQALQ
jgi:hypothetical protein